MGASPPNQRCPRPSRARVSILSFVKSSWPPSGSVEPADGFSLKTVSGREDRWEEFGFDGDAGERFRHENVAERGPLERNGYRGRRCREGGHCYAAKVIYAVRQMAGARGLRACASAGHVSAYGDWGCGHT